MRVLRRCYGRSLLLLFQLFQILLLLLLFSSSSLLSSFSSSLIVFHSFVMIICTSYLLVVNLLECWLQMNDTLIAQGLDNNASSVSQCQAACRAQISPKCLSVDWDKTRTTGSQCFLHSTSQGKRPATGVDHYDLICM